MNDKSENFKESYNDLTESMNETSNYASWLILGVVLGRIYQKYSNFNLRLDFYSFTLSINY